jgi:hypothetical protein
LIFSYYTHILRENDSSIMRVTKKVFYANA